MNNFKPTTPVAHPNIGYAIVPGNQQMKEIAQERIRLTRALCDAAFEYLSFSDQLTLNTVNDPVPEYYTLEMLVKAQRNREALQTQVDQLQATIDSDDMPDMMANMMEAGILGPLKMQLHHIDEHIAEIQKALEEHQAKTQREE